jgi:hypothetical protein
MPASNQEILFKDAELVAELRDIELHQKERRQYEEARKPPGMPTQRSRRMSANGSPPRTSHSVKSSPNFATRDVESDLKSTHKHSTQDLRTRNLGRKVGQKAKRKLSASGRAAIVAALKKRWAAKRATAKAQQSTASKKAHGKAAKKRPPRKPQRLPLRRRRRKLLRNGLMLPESRHTA